MPVRTTDESRPAISITSAQESVKHVHVTGNQKIVISLHKKVEDGDGKQAEEESCPECGQEFDYFNCDECSSSFAEKGSLRGHQASAHYE